jgi:hypothetical protein
MHTDNLRSSLAVGLVAAAAVGAIALSPTAAAQACSYGTGALGAEFCVTSSENDNGGSLSVKITGPRKNWVEIASSHEFVSGGDEITRTITASNGFYFSNTHTVPDADVATPRRRPIRPRSHL